MKSLIITNPKAGLTTFLSENGYKFQKTNGNSIYIQYSTESELFNIAFEFGQFYEKNTF